MLSLNLSSDVFAFADDTAFVYSADMSQKKEIIIIPVAFHRLMYTRAR